MKRLLILFAAMLCGCTALGLAPPQSPQQSIAYGYSGITAALNTLATAVRAGQISSAQAMQVNAKVLIAKQLLDQANASASSSAPLAINLITSATQVLAQVSLYLTCEQQQKGVATCQLP